MESSLLKYLDANLLSVALLPILLLFYSYFIFLILKRKQKRLLFKKFFSAVVYITNNESNNLKCITELKLNFRKLSEKFQSQKAHLRSVTDLLEEFIYFYDTRGEFNFKDIFEIKEDLSHHTRIRVLEIISILRNENPFISLPAKEANFLTIISQALDSDNKELGKNALNQLAQEIEVLNTNLSIQEKRNITSYIVSIVGVILTIVFGIVSLI